MTCLGVLKWWMMVQYCVVLGKKARMVGRDDDGAGAVQRCTGRVRAKFYVIADLTVGWFGTAKNSHKTFRASVRYGREKREDEGKRLSRKCGRPPARPIAGVVLGGHIKLSGDHSV